MLGVYCFKDGGRRPPLWGIKDQSRDVLDVAGCLAEGGGGLLANARGRRLAVGTRGPVVPNRHISWREPVAF